jgi:hypothetical protein
MPSCLKCSNAIMYFIWLEVKACKASWTIIDPYHGKLVSTAILGCSDAEISAVLIEELIALEGNMLPAYGVVVGQFVNYTTNQGQWLHVDLNINAADVQYQAAVDVNEPNGQFQYQVLDNLNTGLFAPLSALPDGWHHLDANSTSGAMDYARSPILQRPLGCLTLFLGFFSAIFKATIPVWSNVTGNEAGNALIAMVTGSTRVFAFGAPYTSGNGVHDVHCNQGDPPGPFRPLDGIWQDGCVFAIKSDGTLSAYLGKFTTQSLNTNNNGIPI